MKRVVILIFLGIVVFTLALETEKSSANVELINKEISASIASSQFDDEFNSSTLDPKWQWIREDPTHWYFSEPLGYLVIVTQHKDIWKYNTSAPILIQNLNEFSSENFEVTTRVVMTPTENYQQGGLLVYEDDDNYIRLTFGYRDEVNVELAKEVDGNYENIKIPTEEDIYDFHLKIRKINTTYYGFYRMDGNKWVDVGILSEVPINPYAIGITAFNGAEISTKVEIPAMFDYFRVDLSTPFLDCSDAVVYSGIQHCTKGETEILFINPDTVRFETSLAQGYDKDDIPLECQDVNTPARVSVSLFPGPRCHIQGNNLVYPTQYVDEMAKRNPNDIAAVAFNADYFDSDNNLWGPQGLTVKNGDRFDGPCYGDDDGGGYNGRLNNSIAFSKDGDIQISIAGDEAPDECNQNNEPYVANPDKYWNTIGGGPLLVEQGVSVVERECKISSRYCPYRFTPRARTAVGKAADGKLIVVVIPESTGVILDDSQNPELEDLSEIMISLGAVEALNLDGGGSSQLWYNGDYLVPSSVSRRVPEGMLVFPICPVEAAVDQDTSATSKQFANTGDLVSLYRQLRDEVLATTDLGQGYIEDYNKYGAEVTTILVTESDLRSRVAQFLGNAAPAFGSLLPNSNEDVILTQTLFDEAEGIVYDLADKGSQELSNIIFQTWDSLALDEHIGETATEIWQQMQKYFIHLPMIQN